MPRDYVFHKRQPVNLNPIIAPIGQQRIDELAAEFLRDTIIHPELAAEVYMAMTPLDLLDLLKQELSEAPHSPVSLEIRRRVRLFCVSEAAEIGKDVESGD